MATWCWAQVSMNLVTITQQYNSTRWECPQNGWFKLNTNGGVDINFGNIRLRDLMRGLEVKWVVGYERNIGVSSVLDAEFQAIVDGLKTA